MVYTHSFEIKINGTIIDGDVAFVDGKIFFFINAPVEMNVSQMQEVLNVLRESSTCHSKFGEITKIEINKKSE